MKNLNVIYKLFCFYINKKYIDNQNLILWNNLKNFEYTYYKMGGFVWKIFFK